MKFLKRLINKQTNTSTSKQANIYRSLDFIPVFNYYKIADTGDLRYLLKLDDYEVLPEIDMTEFESVYTDMRIEVQQYSIDNDQKSWVIFNEHKKVEQLKSDYEVIQVLLGRLWMNKNIDEAKEKDQIFIDGLSKLGYRFTPGKDFHQEIKNIQRKSKQLLTRANLAESELNAITKDNTRGVKPDIWKEIDSIQSYTKMNIDIHKTSMRAYLSTKYRVYKETNKKKK